MAQRAEPHDSLDYFPTPLWATRALVEHVLAPHDVDRTVLRDRINVWEPACGEGHMATALIPYFRDVFASDVHSYGYGIQHDFLMPYLPDELTWPIHYTITNPPFRLAQQFIERALEVSIHGVAMLVRNGFLETQERYETLFSQRPPATIAQFAERVSMVKGKVVPGISTATAYAWVIWTHNNMPSCASPTEFQWIPPCRVQLTKDGDYD